jgi:hypothetical protein
VSLATGVRFCESIFRPYGPRASSADRSPASPPGLSSYGPPGLFSYSPRLIVGADSCSVYNINPFVVEEET